MQVRTKSLAIAAAAGSVAMAFASPAGAAVVADFVAEYREPAPAAGWAYMWNSGGAIGNPANYTNLIYDGSVRYDADGVPGIPTAGAAQYVLVDTGGSVHPGGGTAQGAGVDRYAITAYTISAEDLAAGTTGSLTNVSLVNSDTAENANGTALFVQVNNGTPQSFLANNTNTPPATIQLGTLAAGDVVYVAVGPNGTHNNDGATLSYQIDVVPEPASLGLLALAGLGLMARRRV